MLPVNVEGTEFEGYVMTMPVTEDGRCEQIWVRIWNVTPGNLSLKKADMELDRKFSDVLYGAKSVVRERFEKSENLPSFLVELRSIASAAMADAVRRVSDNAAGKDGGSLIGGKTHYSRPVLYRPQTFYKTLQIGLEDIGWDRIDDVAQDLSWIQTSVTDSGGRTHAVSIHFPFSFPNACPEVLYDLPIQFQPSWNSQSSRLLDIIDEFVTEVEKLQQLMDSLDDLDSNSRVVEPSAPSRSATHRRIVLENHVTLVIKFDPSTYPETIPEMQFLGSDANVAPLLSRMRTRRNLWQQDRLARNNIEYILEIDIPSNLDAMNKELDSGNFSFDGPDLGVDCAICYNYRRDGNVNSDDVVQVFPVEDHVQEQTKSLENMVKHLEIGETPDIYCDNVNCGKMFHRLCLREWLAADASTRHSFGKMFGACPYCSAPISA